MISDQPIIRALIKAMADAADGLGVLFLTPSLSETTAIVSQGKDLVRRATGEIGLAVYREGSSTWHLTVPSTGGWIFFFPQPDISATDEVNNPNVVYYQHEDHTWRRLEYVKWVARGKNTTTYAATMWERLKDD